MANLKQVLDDVKHIGPIADNMSEWDGTVGDALELSYAERQEISEAHPGKLKLQKRMALMKWKQKKGPQATGENLVKAFENIGYRGYADTVKRICKESGGVGGGGGASGPANAVVSSSDAPPKLAKMFKLLLPISSSWKNIGVLLELENANLSRIESEFRGVPDNCLREMLSMWLRQVDPPPTKSALVDAVETYDPTLAQKISAL